MFKSEFPTVDLVTVDRVPPADPSTKKGMFTWHMPMAPDANHAVVMIRDHYDHVGDHYHIPAPGKNPEQLYVLRGIGKFWFVDVHKKRRTIDVNAKKGIVRVSIPPYILHGIAVVSDEIVYFEQAVGPFDPALTKSAADFETLVAQLSD